jgi:Flp pilus assembly protein TadG
MTDRQSRGQTMVEFALILPLIILIVMGIFAFALIFNARNTVAQAAAAGTRVGSTLEYGSQDISGHYNTPIYNAVITNMNWLGKDRIDRITIYQPDSNGGVSSRKDDLDKNGNQKSGGTYNFTNNYRQTDTNLGVEIVYTEPVWLPVVNLITGPTLTFQIRESRRIE